MTKEEHILLDELQELCSCGRYSDEQKRIISSKIEEIRAARDKCDPKWRERLRMLNALVHLYEIARSCIEAM